MPTLKQSHLLPCIHRPPDNPHQNTSQRLSYWRIIADMWHTMLAESASSRYSQTVSSLFQTVIKWSWATLDVASHQLIPGLQPLAGAHPLTLHNGRIWGCQDIFTCKIMSICPTEMIFSQDVHLILHYVFQTLTHFFQKRTYIVIELGGPYLTYIVLAWKGPNLTYIVLAWKDRCDHNDNHRVTI